MTHSHQSKKVALVCSKNYGLEKAETMYCIIDSTNRLVKDKLPTYQSAFAFLISRGRYDWRIKETKYYGKVFQGFL